MRIPENPGDAAVAGRAGGPARVYLDHSATTGLRPVAREAFLEASEVLGNPTSQHTSGRRARGVLDDALESLAHDLGVPTTWLILTSGGTEADNLALRGGALAARAADPARNAVAACATDHPAVVETAQALGTDEKLHVRTLEVDENGLLREEQLPGVLSGGAVSVASAALVNNETGVVQDLGPLARIAHEHGTVVHCDAVQGVGHVPLPTLRGAGSSTGVVDLMTISGHKIGAPVGVGALVGDPKLPLAPVLTGGGQQRGVRSGTLDAALATAFAAALHETLAEAERETARLAALRQRLRTGIVTAAPDAVLTADSAPHSPHILHIMFPGCDQDALLFLLDQQGIDASAGSACTAGVTQASHVLRAMDVAPERARGALRFSLGPTTTEGDVERLLTVLPDAVERARAVGGLLR